VLDVGESCDGGLFVDGVSLCSDYSVDFTGGLLGCSSSCGLDTSNCEGVVGGGFCGDGLIDLGEQCDGVDLNGVPLSCVLFDSNFVSGVVSCTDACVLSTLGCVERPLCGNGVIDGGETCDGL